MHSLAYQYQRQIKKKKKQTYNGFYVWIGTYEPRNRSQRSPFDFSVLETSIENIYATAIPMKENSIRSKNNPAMNSYRLHLPMSKFCHNCPQTLLDAKNESDGNIASFSASTQTQDTLISCCNCGSFPCL